MAELGEIRYARSTGDIDIAYQVIGSGPVDLVYVSGFITHLDLNWDLPHFSWLRQLDGIARLIIFDKRGTGLSDRSLGFGSLDERADDIRVVMDAAGCERAFLFGASEGGPMSILFAATSPERVRGLILYGSFARISQAPDYPGIPESFADEFLTWTERKWGSGEVFGLLIQHSADEAVARKLIARFERNACTPQMAVEIMRRNFEMDVRSTLPSISVPTLIVHNVADPIAPVEFARYLAKHIPAASYVELSGDFHGSWRPDLMAGPAAEAIAFISEGGASARPAHRLLATVLFTDITSSTETTARLGDEAWRGVLEYHERLARTLIDRFGGEFVMTTGDGVLATFDGPTRAIACAQAFRQRMRPLNVQIRVGLHTGEIERREKNIAGMGVVIARRICDQAATGEVLVSRTIKDLVAGSQIEFAERGSHTLKGVPDDWQLFAVQD